VGLLLLNPPEADKIGFALGSFGFVLALGGSGERKTGVGLALFGFVWVRFGFALGVAEGLVFS
jgi:hypothetical protein